VSGASTASEQTKLVKTAVAKEPQVTSLRENYSLNCSCVKQAHGHGHGGRGASVAGGGKPYDALHLAGGGL